ncbi:MAG: sulfatase [Phycisphaerales bacterium]|nr:sulfatase [Phycisphaerales bacterium]
MRIAASGDSNGVHQAAPCRAENMTSRQISHAVIVMCVTAASIDVSFSALLYSSGAPLSALALCFVATAAALGFVLAPMCWIMASIPAGRGCGPAALLHRLSIACMLVPCLPALREAMRLVLLTGLQARLALVLAVALGLPLLASGVWRRWQRTNFEPAWGTNAACVAVAMCAMTRIATHSGAMVTILIGGMLFAVLVAAWQFPGPVKIARGHLVRRPVTSLLVVLVLVTPLMSRELFVPLRSDASMAPRPLVEAVVLITVDTLRWDAIGCANRSSMVADSRGNAGDGPLRSSTLTPHMDALAESSIVFEQARACAPWTLPSCASLLTGVSPDVHGAMRPESRVPSALSTLAERLRSAGYRTAAFGDNPFLRPQCNLSQGFDHYEFYPRPSVSLVGGEILSRVFGALKTDVTAGDLTESACRWLAENSGEPVFLWVHYFDTHGPYAPPMKFQPTRPDGCAIEPCLEYADDIRSGRFMPDLEERRYLRKLYDGEVQFVDMEIGRLVSRLREMNLDQKCLWVFTSDHGEEFWDHESFEHGHSLYDELLHVPLFFKLPQPRPVEGSAMVKRIGAPVGLDSVVPTILDVCGVEARPEELSGASLRSLWSVANDLPSQFAVHGTGLLYFENRSAVVFDGCKYICGSTGRHEQVFDLVADPLERRDLSFGRPDLMERGRALIYDHAERTRKLKDVLQVGDGETVALDDDTRRRLKSLGYID